MADNQPAKHAFRYAPIAFGALAGVVVLLASLGERPATPWIYHAGGTPIAMALQSAIPAFLLACALLLSSFKWGGGILKRVSAGLAGAAIGWNLLTVLGLLAGADSPMGHWFIRVLFDFSRVSPLTALSHAGAGLGFALAMGLLGKGWARRQAGALAALIPLGVGGVVVLSYLAGMPLLYGILMVPMSAGAALSACLLGMGTILLCGFDVWPVALFARQAPLHRPRPINWFLRSPLSVFMTLTLLILGAGSLYRRVHISRARSAAQYELGLIADQKAQQVAAWHRERLLAARQIHRGKLIQRQFMRFLTTSAPAPTASDLLGWMQAMKDMGNGDLTLFDAQGTAWLSTVPGPVARLESPEDLATLQAALLAPDVTVVDLHPGSFSGSRVSLWVPIGTDFVPGHAAEGALLLDQDPETYLFPMLRSWPTPSATAETLLIRRDGERIVFLNGQRKKHGKPLGLSVSIFEHPGLPAVLALTRGDSFVTAPDYQGSNVVAAIRRVPGTSWWLVAKVDEAELFAPLQVRNGLTVTALLGLLLLLALGMGVTLRNYDNRQILGQLALERERQTLAERFQQIMHQANDIILLMAKDGRILEANERAEEAYGYSSAELARMNLQELRAPNAPAEPEPELGLVEHGTLTRVEAFHLRRDGSPFPVEVSARAVTFGGETFLLSFVRDVTERHRQAQAIQRLTQLYAALSQLNQAIVWSVTQEELFWKFCEVLVEFGGFRMAWIGRHDSITRTVLPMCHAGVAMGYFKELEVRTDASPLAHGPVGTAIQENRPCLFNQFLLAKETLPWHESSAQAGFASAAAFPVSVNGEPLFCLAVYATQENFFGTEEMALLVEAARDLSFALANLAQEERRTRAEENLRQSEARLKTLTENAPDIVTMMDAHGRILYVNRPLDGLTRGEVLGTDWLGWIPEEAWPVADQARVAALATGISQEFTAQGISSTGVVRWYHNRISPILGAKTGEAVVLFATDITEARHASAEQAHLEAQLAQSQKLESLGSLAGGVAHDMNNVLGAILSLASAHREQLHPGEPFVTSLDTIISACLRGRGVVKSLLYFAHKDLEQVSAIDVNALVKEMVQLLAYTTLRRIHLEMALQDGLGTLQGDAGALSNTLMNLCVNAMDAMPGGGALTLRTERLADGRLELSVQDTGCGMSKEVQAKAIEPFFTTKPQGKGTGLGLSMAYAMAKAHDGTLEIQSEPDKGTRILLVFPASRMHEPPGPLEPSPVLDAAPGGPWRILLIDDDDLIRDSVAPMLEVLGHEVSVAPGGQEALDLFEQGLQVDLAILDMNMPGLNGAATLPLLLDLRPGLPVLMATGYSDEDIALLLEGRPNVFSIRKPFSLAEIRVKFAEMLG